MDITQWFGGKVTSLSDTDPKRARRLLLTGYRANLMSLKANGGKTMSPVRKYAAVKVMELIINVLSRPEEAAMVSLFVPCEPLFAAGLKPYSVEAVSGYLMGADCEKHFQESAAENGFPETLCSFHRTFAGAADSGLMPAPSLMIYTNVACDGNMISFPHLKDSFGAPAFFIDVPYEKSEDSVVFVSRQLEEMTAFISGVTGRKITRAALSAGVRRTRLCQENYRRYLELESSRRLIDDVTDEMYAAFMSHILLGSETAETYFSMLRDEMESAPDSDAVRLLWLHAIPYMQPSVRSIFNHGAKAFITACDLCYDTMFIPQDENEPYLSMARRLVYNPFNADPSKRIENAVETARLTRSDGAVIFAHMGCKATIGAAKIMQGKIEAAGIPAVILDGDACSPANTGDGQLATRLGAFIEMLEDRR
jgi:benzoyl-CoA reductase/2-hydroxyglutaryl-CoA dehydratase subunit BcrC/BadD/HgdB